MFPVLPTFAGCCVRVRVKLGSSGLPSVCVSRVLKAPFQELWPSSYLPSGSLGTLVNRDTCAFFATRRSAARQSHLARLGLASIRLFMRSNYSLASLSRSAGVRSASNPANRGASVNARMNSVYEAAKALASPLCSYPGHNWSENSALILSFKIRPSVRVPERRGSVNSSMVRW